MNQEIQALQQLLEDGYDVLKPGSRMVVITFHSLEDRLVKHMFKFGNAEGTPIKDMYGHMENHEIITKNIVTPSTLEQKTIPDRKVQTESR